MTTTVVMPDCRI